jgi:hypothetical protein
MKYTNDNWLIKPARRVKIRQNKVNGYFEVYDFETGLTLANTQAETAARIARRKIEASKRFRPRVHICSALLPNPEPWAWKNGQGDESILALMDVHRHYFHLEA